ncbi:MAG: type II secretion system protein [Acidobacteria bacterium]|nr:type II secretion system protein [Acidobacteriota bacterium]
MKRLNKPFASPSEADPGVGRKSRRRDQGFALLILLMLATVMLIMLSAALPSVLTQGQREKEEELIFRGNEYARAIAMYRRQFRRFPTDVKELLRTNGIRFLRHEYTDPMTRKGKWRFIHADASGTPIDSRTIARTMPAKPLGEGGATSDRKSMFSDEREKDTTDSQPSSGTEEKKDKSSFFGDDMKGAFIIGVASMSNKNSIRVYNNKTRYSDWEFMGIETGGGGTVPGAGSGIPTGVQPGGRGPGFGGRPGLPSMPPLTDQPR